MATIEGRVERGVYPETALDLPRLNSVLRHRIRNLCAGMRMALSSMEEGTAATHPEFAERFALMTRELDDLLRFSERFDLVFHELPEAQPLHAGELVQVLARLFRERFPLCSLDLEGPEGGGMLLRGSWYRLALWELLLNAGEAVPRDGWVKLVWRFDPAPQFAVLNPVSAPWPEMIALDPPRPFHTTRGRHDGMGLCIAHRLAQALGAVMQVRVDLPDAVAARLTGTPEDYA